MLLEQLALLLEQLGLLLLQLPLVVLMLLLLLLLLLGGRVGELRRSGPLLLLLLWRRAVLRRLQPLRLLLLLLWGGLKGGLPSLWWVNVVSQHFAVAVFFLLFFSWS